MTTTEQDAWVAETFGIDRVRLQAPAASGAAATGMAPAASAADAAPAAIEKQRAELGKMAAIWHKTEAKVRADLATVRSHLDELFEGDPAAGQMEKDFQVHLDAIFATFDGTLAKDLASAAKARDPAEMAAINADLRRTIESYAAFLAHDSIALMDDNPFVDIDIAASCQATLKTMQQYIA